MNRRYLAVIAVVIAIGLFAAPLISPVPSYDTHLEVSVVGEPDDFSTKEERKRTIGKTPAIHYQNLSIPAQRLFERAKKFGWSSDVAVPFDKAPESLATLAPKKAGRDTTRIYIRKDGLYYYTLLQRFTPGPSLQAFMLRLGPLLGAIGLGTLAGYFVLTAED